VWWHVVGLLKALGALFFLLSLGEEIRKLPVLREIQRAPGLVAPTA
jgi:hypothetical protein